MLLHKRHKFKLPGVRAEKFAEPFQFVEDNLPTHDLPKQTTFIDKQHLLTNFQFFQITICQNVILTTFTQ